MNVLEELMEILTTELNVLCFVAERGVAMCTQFAAATAEVAVCVFMSLMQACLFFLAMEAGILVILLRTLLVLLRTLLFFLLLLRIYYAIRSTVLVDLLL